MASRGTDERAKSAVRRAGRTILRGAGIAALTVGVAAMPTPDAQARVLQCVPYARDVSGIAIFGDAHLWWDRAEGRYARGREPREGAVLAFRATRAMPLGHVAVVREILDERRIVLDHANWSGPGRIERSALAVDVSEAGDWSAVRVWFAPIDALGGRQNPTFGFIYNAPPAPDGVQHLPGVLAFTTGRQGSGHSGAGR